MRGAGWASGPGRFRLTRTQEGVHGGRGACGLKGDRSPTGSKAGERDRERNRGAIGQLLTGPRKKVFDVLDMFRQSRVLSKHGTLK